MSNLRLGSACLKIGSGATPRGGKDVYIKSGDIALIRSQNIYNDRFERPGLVYLTPEHAKQLDNVSIMKADVLLNITGDSVARVCQVPDDVLPARVNQHVAIIRTNPKLLDSRFLRFFLVSQPMQQLMLGLAAAGATRNALTKGMIESFEIPDISLVDQQAIGIVLGALEDKIDRSRRMNETLESMAQLLFKDWFIDFGPVRAKMEGRQPPGLAPEIAALFPDALDENGKPIGWSEKRIDNILELAYGKALKATERIAGEVPVYGSGGITGYHNEHLVDGPSIVVGRKGTVGSLYWEDRSFFPIDTVFYVKPKVPLTFCYYLLQVLGLNDMNTDAAVPGLNRNNVYRLSVPWAKNDVTLAFDEIVKPLRNKIYANIKEIRTLTDLRDLLLPKLMSGEICVRNAKSMAEEVV